MKLQPVRGTHDILPEECARRSQLVDQLKRVAVAYGYGEIATPIFEFSEVFHRTLGDTSDVVTKETYTFDDRGGTSITLRPEFTASVVRALISNGLQESLPFKVFYHGPAFRYERPQKGRLRQFHQFGVECLGDNDPLADVQMIALADHMLGALGLRPHVTLELNSLGDDASRVAYREALVAYFSDHRATLSEDSQKRLEKNPLRILDSKDEGDRKLIAGAPSGMEYFTSEAKAFFATVEEALKGLSIAYTLNPQLVRGLDYYSHTVFEFTTQALGAQGTVLAGGRYDGLVKRMGGQDIAGIGFAAGIERLLALVSDTKAMEFAPAPRPVAVIPVEDAQEQAALALTQKLRIAGVRAELLLRGNMSKKMKRASAISATSAILLGEEEWKRSQVVVKDLDKGSQQEVALDNIVEYIRTL